MNSAHKKFKVWENSKEVFLAYVVTAYNCVCNSHSEDDLEFFLYSGFPDKNGNEICEGDFLRLFIPETADGAPTLDEIHLVEFRNAGFCFEDGFFIGNLDSQFFEIIGNIKQNPELMEKIKQNAE